VTATHTGQGAFTERVDQTQNINSRVTTVAIYTSQTGGSPNAGTITASWSGEASLRTVLLVYEITGHDTSSPVGASGTNIGVASTLTATLSATPASTSLVLAAIACAEDTTPNNIGVGSGFTEANEVDSGGSAVRVNLEVMYDSVDADNSADWSNLNTVNNVGGAIEVKEAVSGIAGSLSKTLAALTVSSTGTVEAGTGIIGELSVTLGALTLVATSCHGILYTDGPSGDVNTAQDVNLHQTAATYNGGTHSAIQFGSYNYGLLRFDLSAIPAGAVIHSAKLSLGLYQGGGTADIYAVLAVNGSWIEGTKNLALAGSGEPCWNALAADGSGGITTAWTGGSNGCGVVGTDISASAIGQVSAASAGVYEVDLDLTTVQAWFGTSNPGLLIKPTATNSNHIALSEYADAAYRPKLVVLYTNSVSGSLTRTLDSATLIATGEVADGAAIQGVLEQTLDSVTLFAAGEVAIQGVVDLTLNVTTLQTIGVVSGSLPTPPTTVTTLEGGGQSKPGRPYVPYDETLILLMFATLESERL